MAADIANLYMRLRQRVALHVPRACMEVSVPIPTSLDDELSFYRLVNWAYVLLNEAAKIPLTFLCGLPPLRENGELKSEVGQLRTYVAHNLDVAKPRDAKTAAFAQCWFRNACGRGSPLEKAHFEACSALLAQKLRVYLQGALDACDLLDDGIDGPRLVTDLKGRIDLFWDAFRFDPIVAECAAELGNPGLDLITLRKKHLDAWRKVLAEAEEGEREKALRIRIEASLLQAIADALPVTAKEVLQKLAMLSPEALVAALLILRDAQSFGRKNVSTLLTMAYEAACQTNSDAIGD